MKLSHRIVIVQQDMVLHVQDALDLINWIVGHGMNFTELKLEEKLEYSQPKLSIFYISLDYFINICINH